VVPTGGTTNSGGFFSSLLHNITSSVEGDASSELSSLTSSLARAVGVADFYSAYVLDYCSGSYEPQPVPNATLPAHDIKRNVTYCSPHATGHYNFTPGAALQQTLDETHTGVTLADLHWPSEIDTGIDDLHEAMNATLALYALGIAFAGLAMLAALAAFGASSVCAAVTLGILAFLGFLAFGVASGAVTAVAVKATREVNKYGAAISVSASKGDGFLALTWAATGCMLVASLAGCLGMCGGRRAGRRSSGKYV
jgi:hypothetical protein